MGCLRDVFLKKVHHPYEVWELLTWQEATEKRNAYESWEGCPSVVANGVHFLGKGIRTC